MLPDLETLGALAVYGLVGALVFVESGLLVGFFLPGDTVLFAAGLWSADPRSGVSPAVLAAVVFVAAVAGDAVGYAIGAKGGPALLRRHQGRYVNGHNLARAQAFAERWGSLAVVTARWVPWVRTFVPLLAGATGMPYRRFLLANVVGALTWGVGLVVLGHLAGSVPWLRDSALLVAGGVVAASVLGAGVSVYRRRSASRR